jgi:outer membrane murein-binding lipoprotein Lpp
VRIEEFEAIVEKINGEKEEAKLDKERYEKKHDEMFQAVSGLNARIEELEQHKLHLL